MQVDWTPLEFQNRIKNSAGRLVKLIDLNAPKEIIANEIAIIMRFALTLYGEELGSKIGMFFAASLRNSFKTCQKCMSPLEGNQDFCPACKKLEDQYYD